MELGKNAHLHMSDLWQHSVETAKSNSDNFTTTVFVQLCLSTCALKAFEQACHEKRIKSKTGEEMSTVLATEKALLAEVQLTASSGAWSSLLQMMVAATVTQKNIHVVCPEVTRKLRPLLHRTVEPLQAAATRPTISFMWSDTSPGTNMTGKISLNHFVPLFAYEAVHHKLPAVASLQQGLKEHKHDCLVDFLLA